MGDVCQFYVESLSNYTLLTLSSDMPPISPPATHTPLYFSLHSHLTPLTKTVILSRRIRGLMVCSCLDRLACLCYCDFVVLSCYFGSKLHTITLTKRCRGRPATPLFCVVKLLFWQRSLVAVKRAM